MNYKRFLLPIAAAAMLTSCGKSRVDENIIPNVNFVTNDSVFVTAIPFTSYPITLDMV